MSNYHHQSSKKYTSIQARCQQYIDRLARLLVILGLMLGGVPLWALRVVAAPTPGNTTIDNQATGTFSDLDDTSAGTQNVVSNVVSVTVAEVAGITVTSLNTPVPVAGAVSNFDFTVTNVGNDPTKFFIPGAPSAISGGTAGTLKIMSYDPDGSGPLAAVDLTANNITVPPAGADTGTLLGAIATANNGAIPAGATIVVRVPVTVGATATSVSVTLGNTTSQPSNSNTPYLLGANGTGTDDLYTVDHTDPSTVVGEVTGMPINGDSTLHRQEASATKTVTLPTGPSGISGTVFEDVNYGGGAGRPLSTAGTSARNGVTVELYNSTGTYVSSTTTSGGGKYSFTSGITAGNYYIRIVNSTVTSSRPGAVSTLSAVQTFRTNASTGTAVDDPNRVGGEKPSVADTGAAGGSAKLNTTNFSFATAGGSATVGGQAESITPVTVGASTVSGVDFGYNFDTIVNTNDAGQGSLRQFIINSNTLTNAGLNQVANPSPAPGTTAVDPAAGEEASIFMIPVSALTSNVAVITPTTTLPTITDSFTTITGTTQSINIGDTNSGQQGTGGTVGVDGLTLSKVNKPEVQIVGSASFASGLTVSGANTTIRGLSIYGFGRGPGNVIDANIQLANNTANTKIEQNFLGSTATSFSRPAAGTGSDNIFLGTGSTNAIVQNNLIGFANLFGVLGVGTKNLTFENNEVRQNSYIDAGKDGISLEDPGNTTNLIQGNLLIDQGGNGIDSYGSNGQLSVKNNTVTGNGVGSTSGLGETPGVRLYGTGNTVYRNIIFNNYGAGVMVTSTSQQGIISQNSIYGNGTILAKNGAAASGQIGIDLLVSGNPDQTGTSPYVSANDGSAAAGGNNGMDYPVISSSSLSGGTLTVSGYIGNNTAGSATFANATVEFFISEGTNQNLGQVIVGDGKSLSHGEGKTYIGSCVADANGLFTNCTFANAGTLGLTNAENITATATSTTGNTSEFSASPPAPPPPPSVVCPTVIVGEFAGTFGTISSATKYRDLQNPVAGYTYAAPFNTTQGEYVVTSAAYGSNVWNAFGAQVVTGHTTGAIDDAFLLVNGSTSVGTFYQQTINVSPNRNVDVSVWVRNWTAAGPGYDPPSITINVYAANGTTLLGSAAVNNVAIAAGWVEALGTINTGTNSQIVVKLQNTSTSISGNDFAIDDISVRYSSTPCLIASGSISGTVFSDADANVAINGTDAGTNAGSSTLTVYAVDTSGKVVDKATVDAITGNYTLSDVPQNSSVKLRLSNDDTVAIGATAPTAPSLPTGWYHTGENLNGTIDPVITTLGDIALTTTTANLTNENFGIRQATTIAADPAPATCTANFTTALNTGVSAAGGQLAIGANDLNWTAEWIAGPAGTHPSPFGTPYAPPRPVGPMPAVVLGNLNPGIWVNEPSNARWISYPFRLSTNGNGVHSNADLDANIGEDGSANPIIGTSDTVRLKFTATITLPSNANSIAVSLPVGVAMDNQFGSLKVNGVENLSPVPAPNPQANNFSSLQTVNMTQGWQPGVNTIEIVMDSGQPQAGFFLGVQATSTQVCKTKANVLMVKRVTAINGNSTKNPNDNTPLNLFVDDTSATPPAPNDNHCNWPGATGSTGACTNTYTKGALVPGKVKPGDEIEYTIYYLNSGESKAKQVRICDQLDNNLTFKDDFDNDPAHVGRGITLVPGIPGVPLSTDIQYLTNAGGDDKGEVATAPVSSCNLTGNTGTNLSSKVVVVDVAKVDAVTPANSTILNGSTGAGIPTTSYGYIRIKTTVK